MRLVSRNMYGFARAGAADPIPFRPRSTVQFVPNEEQLLFLGGQPREELVMPGPIGQRVFKALGGRWVRRAQADARPEQGQLLLLHV